MATRADDTELGLYDSAGNLIDDDDDGGAGLYSSITATLDIGTYYIAVGEFNTVFGDFFSATGNGQFGDTEGGDYWINIIPEPGTALLLGLGVVGLIRRRR